MNMMKWIITLLLAQTVLFAESLDPNRYQKIKRVLSQTGHLDLEDMKRSMESIVSYPAPYLRTLSEEAGVRIYVKERAIMLLSHYPDGDSENLLKGNVANQALHPSLRKFSARSLKFQTHYILDNRQQTTTRGCHEAEKTIHNRV